MDGVKQLCRFIMHYKMQVLLAGILGSCTVLCSVGLLGASAVLISKAAIVPAMLELMTLVALVRFFGLFRAVFRYTERLVTHDVTLKVLADLRSWYYRKLIPLLPGAVGNKGAKLFKNILADIELLQYFYLRVVAAPLVCIIVLLVMGTILYFLVPQAAGILLLAFLLEGVVFPLLFGAKQKQYTKAEQVAQDAFYRSTNDFLLGFDAVWFGAKDTVERVKRVRQEMYQHQRRIRNLETLLQFCNGIIGVFVLAGSYYAAASAVGSGALQGIYLVMVPLMAWSALEAVQPMPMAVRHLFESDTAMQDMLTIVNTPARGREQKDSEIVADIPWGNAGIVFDHVSFSYDQSEPVLQDLSFSVAPGTHTAIIGGIGSGKSTIMHLLLGYYRQNEGNIIVDGVDINSTNTTQLGAHIAVVRQDTALFSGSIRDNLSNVADCSEEQMWDALRKAELYDYVQSLPGGLDYMLLESGSNLSGGQKKRMALAQLFLQDKPIVLLDEVLEGLDEKNTASILQSIIEYCKGRTMLYITHDLSVLKEFDAVIALSNGTATADVHPMTF